LRRLLFAIFFTGKSAAKESYGMRNAIRAILFAAVLAGLLSPGTNLLINAQGSQATTLALLKPTNGAITAAKPEQHWTFSAVKNQRLSVRMQAVSGNLDPYVELKDASGKVLATSTNASLRNATIDDFIVPEKATYTVRATRASGGSTGNYTLTLMPGFSFLLLNNPKSTNSPLRLWNDTNAVAHYADGKLEIQLVGEKAYTYTSTTERFGAYKDLYMQTDVHSQQSGKYWEAGLLFRGNEISGIYNFYVYFINSDGKWKLAYSQPNGLKNIQDWTDLPAKPQDDANIAIMVKGKVFTPFYNGQALGDVTDGTISDAGQFGFAVGTGVAPNINTQIRFDNILVTLPADEATVSPVLVPNTLVNWQRAQEALLDELRKVHLIPNTGKIGLEIKDKAFVTNNGAVGIQFQPLAESKSFADVVYSADITWESSNENIACAMELRAADDNNFTIVYVDRKGGYGIRQLSSQEGTPIALYYLSDTINKTNKATNRVTIIAIGNSLIVYVNGVLVANLSVKQTTGGVRIAAYNYQQASSICQFTNLWLRSFDR